MNSGFKVARFQSFGDAIPALHRFEPRNIEMFENIYLKESKMNSKYKPSLALVLAVSMATSACSPQWISVALQDLPVLTQMALNIATLAGTFSRQQNTSDIAVIQNVSAQASRDLNLLLTLYNQYKSAPNATTLSKIQAAITELNQHVPALLESAHISNPLLTVRVTAAVNLILATVNDFAALIPSSGQAKARKAIGSLPTTADLKRQWNQQVCAPDSSIGDPLRCFMR
jgi:hypothetical protein